MNVGYPQAVKRSPKNQMRCAAVLLPILHAALSLAAALILPLRAGAGEQRYPDAVTVFRCGFGEDWDVNYDQWPDRWVRKTGLGYPHYVKIGIQDDTSVALAPEIGSHFCQTVGNVPIPLEPASFALSCALRARAVAAFYTSLSTSRSVGHKCLQIDLDGAAAAVSSPPIRVMSRFSYLFEARLKNTELKHSSVVVTLDFCDSNDQILQTSKTEPIPTTNGWQDIQLGPVEPNNPAIDHVVIGLQVAHTN
jgi:hypothetical protein